MFPANKTPFNNRYFIDEYEQFKAEKGENDPIYFADAIHPQHNSILSYGWIKKGQEKELKARGFLEIYESLQPL